MNKINKKEKEMIMLRSCFKSPPAQVTLNIDEYEQDHRQTAVNGSLNGYIKTFEDCHQALTIATAALGPRKKNKQWTPLHSLQAVFFSKIPKTLYVGFELATRGNYDESLAVTRIAYEDLLRILYIQKKPENYEATFIKPKKGKPKFKASRVISDLYKATDDDVLYRIFSYTVHSQQHKVLKELIEGAKRGNIELSLGYEGYDKKQFGMCLNSLLEITYFSIRIYNKLFNNLFVEPYLIKYKQLVYLMKASRLKEGLKIISKVIKEI